MKICGVELTANDAVICLLALNNQQFNIPDCRVRKITLPKEHDAADLQKFQATFAKLLADYGVDKVAIKGRLTKGKFAGGALSFKMEAAIQLIADAQVEVLTTSQVKTALSDNPMPIPFANTGLKGFQQGAFTVAYAAQVM